MRIHLKIGVIVFLLVCLNKLSFAQSNVWISGKLLTDQKEGDISLRNDLIRFGAIKNIAQAHVDSSGNFKFKFNISKPQVILLLNKVFYISQGDSVTMNVTGSRYKTEKIEIKGRNANQYIYSMRYDSLMRVLPFKWNNYNYNNGLVNFLDSANMNKNILINHLSNFSIRHKLTIGFKQYALNQIIYNYYYHLLFPFIFKQISKEQIPSSYSSILDQIKLTNNSLIDKSEYFYTANNLLRYKKIKSNGTDLQLINENATGLTKDQLLVNYAGKLISSYEPKDSLVTNVLFNKIDKEIKSTEYRNYFKTLIDKLKCLSPLPKEVSLTVLTDSLGKRLTFKDILAKSNNKIIVLDFWASWCGPCKEGMPKVNALKKNFRNSDVEFVFISIDNTEKDWRDGLKNTKIPGNQYWVNDNYNSALVKFLTIPAIPRYVIINKTGIIEKINAASPEEGDLGLQQQITKLLSHKI